MADFSGITRDIVSDLYQYMTPAELFRRRQVDPQWRREWQKRAPEWALSRGALEEALESGDLEFLEFALRQRMDSGWVLDDTTLRSLVNTALELGKLDIAIWLIRNFAPDEKYCDYSRLALADDEYLRRYLESGHPVDKLLHNPDDLVNIFRKALSKAIVDSAWIREWWGVAVEELRKHPDAIGLYNASRILVSAADYPELAEIFQVPQYRDWLRGFWQAIDEYGQANPIPRL